MNIKMIGASGFVGTRLISKFMDSENDYHLSNIDLLPSIFFNEISKIGDVRDQICMDEMLKGGDCVVLLAAQHRDDVSPTSLYYDTNVGGLKVTLKAMEKNKIKRLIFFSSVAVYGINKDIPNEDSPKDPFNHYGKSKWEAEKVLIEWFKTHSDWNINIVRPTVIFGERNRGNVFNLLQQISTGKFLMIGDGNNMKSMAYVDNVVAFVVYLLENCTNGYNVFNYIDKPDLDMNKLICLVSNVLNKNIPSIHFPYWLGLIVGYGFDFLAFITRRKFQISSVRVRKFCATTQFDATKVLKTSFKAPCNLEQGLAKTLEFEFLNQRIDNFVFKSE